MICRSSHPPRTPTTPPTASCSRKCPKPLPTADQPLPVAPSRLTIRAMPTGSFAPDSPSRSVPERPEISRRPSTEKTTAGSVGASAAPMSSAVRQSNPKIRWAAMARAPAVTTVPATPSHTTAVAAVRMRPQPMCMPPSKRINASAIVTMRWSTTMERPPSRGTTSDAIAARIRKSAGVGTWIRSARRFEPTATSTANATNSVVTAKGTMSCTRESSPGQGRATADQASRHTTEEPTDPRDEGAATADRRGAPWDRSDVHAEVPGDTDQPGRVALPHRPELPLLAVAVELAEQHRRLGRRVLGEVVARHLGAAGAVDDPDERVADLAEALPPRLAVVDRDREDDLDHLGRDGTEIHVDRL